MKKLLSIVLICFASCEEQVDWNLSGEDAGILVVDGRLTNENTNHLVKLSLSNQFQNEGFQPASGAIVIVSDGTNNVPLTEVPAGSGHYYTPVLQAVVNKDYVLYVNYQGNEYFASDKAIPVTLLEPIQIQPQSDTSRVLRPTEVNQEPSSLISHYMSWEHTPYCVPSDTCIAKLNFYNINSVDLNKLFPPGKEEVLFPPRTIIVRKKYSLSDAYEQYLRSVLSETEWRGGIFDIQRGNVETNISNGALGFFSVSMVTSDTTVSY